MAMSTSLLRVHSELSKIARERMGEDEVPTEIPGDAMAMNEPVATLESVAI